MHNELANKLLIHQWNRDLAKRTAAPTMSAQEQQTAANQQIQKLIQSATKAWEEADRSKSKIADLTEGVRALMWETPWGANNETQEQWMQRQRDKATAQAEEIARLTAELASLQRSYEGERHCSGERMAQILELKREVERLTAERDRLTVIINQQGQRLSKRVWYDASVKPDCRDYPIVQDNDQQKMVVESGSSLCLINAKRWCSIPKAPAPSAEEVERERFEKVFSYWNLSRKADGDYVNPVAQGQWQGWQARAAKEVKATPAPPQFPV